MTCFATPIDLYRVLLTVWAADTASPPDGWTAAAPARNHCSVTSLIVQDYFGGDLLKTQTAGGTHFYNMIAGRRWDLTISQFVEPIAFDDTPASRAMALADTGEPNYAVFAARVARAAGQDHPARASAPSSSRGPHPGP